MIKVYGKLNCGKCEEIKKFLEDSKVEFEYICDDNAITEKALELRSQGKLIEMIAPLVICDGVQIKHKDINEII